MRRNLRIKGRRRQEERRVDDKGKEEKREGGEGVEEFCAGGKMKEGKMRRKVLIGRRGGDKKGRGKNKRKAEEGS